LTTKEAAPAAIPQVLFLDGRRQMVFNPAAPKELFNQHKNTTYANI
jgi:hypothetical protein